MLRIRPGAPLRCSLLAAALLACANAAADEVTVSTAIDAAQVADIPTPRLVFVNGRVSDAHSDLSGLPAVAAHKGRLVHVSNGNAGAECLAYSNGTSWLRVVFGAAVATTTASPPVSNPTDGQVDADPVDDGDDTDDADAPADAADDAPTTTPGA